MLLEKVCLVRRTMSSLITLPVRIAPPLLLQCTDTSMGGVCWQLRKVFRHYCKTHRAVGAAHDAAVAIMGGAGLSLQGSVPSPAPLHLPSYRRPSPRTPLPTFLPTAPAPYLPANRSRYGKLGGCRGGRDQQCVARDQSVAGQGVPRLSQACRVSALTLSVRPSVRPFVSQW